VKRIRQILLRYKVAAAAGGALLAVVAGWGAYQAFVAQPQPQPLPPAAHVAGVPPARPPVTPVPAPAPSGAGGPKEGTGGAPSTAPGPEAAGRPDPFQPLVGEGRGPSLPPVPSLNPEGGPSPLGPVLGPTGALRLVGLLGDGEALAIVADERGSYIVGPGDEIGPEVQVVRIDFQLGRVEVRRQGVQEELMLQQGGGAQ
jgi:hypothetical protein